MGLEQRKQSYLQRVFGFVIVFAVIGCIVLVLAVNHVSNMISKALPPPPAADTR